MQVNGKKQQRRIRTILWSISIIAFLFALFVGVNVRRALQNAAGFAHFWQEKANKPVPANAIRLVALGDSATQAIGADTPMEGFVERITTYVQAKTGRPVHITNVSAGGATYADVAKIFTHEGVGWISSPGCPRISIAKDMRIGFSRFSQRSIPSCNASKPCDSTKRQF